MRFESRLFSKKGVLITDFPGQQVYNHVYPLILNFFFVRIRRWKILERHACSRHRIRTDACGIHIHRKPPRALQLQPRETTIYILLRGLDLPLDTRTSATFWFPPNILTSHPPRSIRLFLATSAGCFAAINTAWSSAKLTMVASSRTERASNHYTWLSIAGDQ